MFSPYAAWDSALLYFAVSLLLWAWLLTGLPPLALVWDALSWARQLTGCVTSLGDFRFPRYSEVALVKPSWDADEAASDWISDRPACDCAWVTEMLASAATWSMIENLISHVSTARGCSAAVSETCPLYDLIAPCRFE